jgi:hypothetical protein
MMILLTHITIPHRKRCHGKFAHLMSIHILPSIMRQETRDDGIGHEFLPSNIILIPLGDIVHQIHLVLQMMSEFVGVDKVLSQGRESRIHHELQHPIPDDQGHRCPRGG